MQASIDRRHWRGVLDIIGTAETVTGSYVSNSLVSTQLFGEVNNGQVTASGGAINVSGKGKVKEISGIFKDNLAKATSLNTNSTIAQGGAINIYAGGTVDEISNSLFENNKAYVESQNSETLGRERSYYDS